MSPRQPPQVNAEVYLKRRTVTYLLDETGLARRRRRHKGQLGQNPAVKDLNKTYVENTIEQAQLHDKLDCVYFRLGCGAV